MLITNDSVNKWNKGKDCEYCLETEDTEHKIFNCKLIKPIRDKFELCFKIILFDMEDYCTSILIWEFKYSLY